MEDVLESLFWFLIMESATILGVLSTYLVLTIKKYMEEEENE